MVRSAGILVVSFLVLLTPGLVAAVPNVRLTSDPGASLRPRICLDPGNNVVVVWQDDRFGNNEILWQKFDQVGTPLTAVVRVTNTSGNSARPDVFCDQAGTSHIVWQEGENGNGVGTVYLCRLDGAGAKTFGDLLIKDLSGDCRVSCPSAGTSDLFWHRFAVTDQDVYYRRYNSGGTQTCERRFNAGTIPGISKTPALCSAPNGDAQLFWRDMTTSFQLHLRHGAATNSCASGAAIAYNNSNAQNPATDAGGSYIFTLFEVSGDIYNFLGAPNACKISQGSGTSTQPSVSADGTQGYGAWRDTRDGNAEIYFCTYSGCSSSTGDVRLTNDASVSETPDLVVEESGTGRWIVVWSDGRDGNRELYLTSQLVPDTPEAPSGLAASLLCPPMAELHWEDNSASETGFELQREENGSGTWTTEATLPSGTTSWVSGALAYGSSYAFRVRSCNGSLCSVWAGPASLQVLDPEPVTIIGAVRGQVVERPYTATPVESGLPNTRVALFRGGIVHGSGTLTGTPTGDFALTDTPRCDDRLVSLLENPILRVAESPEFGCSSECMITEQIQDPAAFTWVPGDAVNAMYLSERYAREYWHDRLGVDLVMPYIVIVGDRSEGVANLGGALTGTGAESGNPITKYAPGLAEYADGVYHEFVHRMVIEHVGELLSQGRDVFREAGAMDEGLADYFTAAFTGNTNFGVGIPTIGAREMDQAHPVQYSICSGKYDEAPYYGARIVSGALWDAREALLGQGAGPNAVDLWIWNALGQLRGIDPGQRTFRGLRDALLTTPPFDTPELADLVSAAFARHNITDNPEAICPARSVIMSAERNVDPAGQQVLLRWTSVPEAASYRLYVREYSPGAEVGLGPGQLVADDLLDTTYVYSEADTSLVLAFVVTGVDTVGSESPPSDELPAVTAVSEPPPVGVTPQIRVAPNPSRGPVTISFRDPAGQAVTVGIYDVAGRRVRELPAGPVHGEEIIVRWDGMDAWGRHVVTGLYFARVEGGPKEARVAFVLLR